MVIINKPKIENALDKPKEEKENAGISKKTAKRVIGRPFPKGVSGNPSGRPKDTLKQFMAKKLRLMSDKEKEAFLKDIPKDLKWRMSEGNPATEQSHQGEIKIIVSSESLDETDDTTNKDSEG